MAAGRAMELSFFWRREKKYNNKVSIPLLIAGI
jgi:hypothetical protein